MRPRNPTLARCRVVSTLAIATAPLAAVPLATLVALGACAAPVGPDDGEPEAEDVSAAIVNGKVTHGYPTVGQLVVPAKEGPATTQRRCSGTLVGCRTFITAAHCVKGRKTRDVSVYLPNAGVIHLERMRIHPGYTEREVNEVYVYLNDIAVLTLARPATGVRPTPINDARPIAPGTRGTLVGYGDIGGWGFKGMGIKRTGRVVTAMCDPRFIQEPGYVCWDFRGPLGPAGQNSNTCHGDSGGPLLVNAGGTQAVAGLTHQGTNAACKPHDHSFDISVYHQRDFIRSVAGSSAIAAASAGAPPVCGGHDFQRIGSFHKSLDRQRRSRRHVFDAKGSPRKIIFALNAERGLHVLVRVSRPGASKAVDCGLQGETTALCSFARGARAGRWTVDVEAARSTKGEYQLTATALR